MARRSTKGFTGTFTVRIDPDDHRRLAELADSRRPHLPLNYLIQYAVQDLLRKAEDPQFVLSLRDPLDTLRINK
jgi:predicted HicB family RNase H-like nuclease